MKAVPGMKYALAVLGLVSAVAIVKGWGVDFRVAVYGAIVMMVLMVALIILARLTKVRSRQVGYAALVLMWAFLGLTVGAAAMLFTSAFFDFPKALTQLFMLVGGPQ
jgi:hypothetical protein